MKTPISDFVKKYAEAEISRFHMPGHKGKSFLGCEPLDITEITGADVLYSCNGIIKESEDHTSSLFGTAHSFFSTEGSTLCIKAMLALAIQGKEKPLVLAGRNVHKAFCYAAALLDLDVDFIYSASNHLCSCEITAEDAKRAIEGCNRMPDALYITTPDYLGNIAEVEGIARVCREYDIPLLCDNAHGAYLKFLPKSLHPIDLGASMCCDSAHKTLPVLTGGAYLHISKDAPKAYLENAREMLSLFASTSPSYLIMQSLDLCNKYLAGGFCEKLADTIGRVNEIKEKISAEGFCVKKSEPLKLVIEINEAPKLCEYLHNNKIEGEFCDEDTLVFMISTENTQEELSRLCICLKTYGGDKAPKREEADLVFKAQRVMSIRSAMLSQSELVNTRDAVGRISAAPAVSCPPAVPIAVSGELITAQAAALFEKYNIERISVVK